jgi:hypothetical protein
MDINFGKRIIELPEKILGNFNEGDWDAVGLLTGRSGVIDSHPRLLRSLSWKDEDYPGNVLSVLKSLATADPNTVGVVEEYINEHYPGDGTYISAKPSERKTVFSPNVFEVPAGSVEPDLVAVMMPFHSGFNAVFAALKAGCVDSGRRCLRADDLWEASTIIQDIFNLIYRAHIVLVDFTGKNANVMYETGFAHTLGKHVIPISQSLDDVPSDMGHHRVLKYLPNQEGLGEEGWSYSNRSGGSTGTERERFGQWQRIWECTGGWSARRLCRFSLFLSIFSVL